MTRRIERRLQKLESRVPPPPPTEEEKIGKSVRHFLCYAVAHYLGDPTPGGSLAEAWMRALGYPPSYGFRKAMDDPSFQEKVRLANTKLLEKFGVSSEHEWEEIVDALWRMHAGFPDRYKALDGIMRNLALLG
jgi:hypothetical protein